MQPPAKGHRSELASGPVWGKEGVKAIAAVGQTGCGLESGPGVGKRQQQMDGMLVQHLIRGKNQTSEMEKKDPIKLGPWLE